MLKTGEIPPKKVMQMRTFILALMALVAATVAHAQSAYQIKSGDTLRIEVLEDPSLNRSVLVLPDGRISFPFVGTIVAGGRSTEQVESALSSAIAPNFATAPSVFVSIANLRPDAAVGGPVGPTVNIHFLGEVNAPGKKALERGTTLLQALAETGGFTKFAAQKRVQLRRTDRATGKQTVFTYNYRAIANGAAVTNDVVLQDGDVILVPERRLFE